MTRFPVSVSLCIALALSLSAALLPRLAHAQAQPLNEAARGVVGAWEFSSADRERKCQLKLLDEPSGKYFRVELEQKCLDEFPFVAVVKAWRYPDNDQLYLLDGAGKVIVEFSEVESRIFEAPTPGQGVLFLQSVADANAEPPPPAPDKFVGDWTIGRGGKALCRMSFSTTPTDDGFAVTVKPDCDPAIARLGFQSWRIDRDELMLKPGRGNPWRFEEDDGNQWSRVPETANPYTLSRDTQAR